MSLDIGTKMYVKEIFDSRLSSNTTNSDYLLQTSFLDIRNLCNDGISFGMLSSIKREYLQILISVIFIGLLVYSYFLITSNKEKIYWILMIISGAMANLLDRFQNGCVYDFIDLHFYSYHWYVFNLADAYITIGAILLVIIPDKEISQ
jgi:signal peptidase II